MKKNFWIGFLIVGIIVGVFGDFEDTPESTKVDGAAMESENIKVEVLLPFLDGLDYSTEQIDDMRTLLLNVGISEISDLDVRPPSYGIQLISGVVFTTRKSYDDPNEVRVHFGIENGTIFLVEIHCPSSYGRQRKPTYLDGLTDRRADLYYDEDGGYLKKIDWENRAVVDWVG